MPFDPATIITSAVVGGFSGLVFATWKTGLEETAKRRMVARDQVHDATSEVLMKVITYEAGFDKGQEGVPDTWIGHYEWASTVVMAARRLGPIRQRLVKRRLRIIVGTTCRDLAYARPAIPGDNHESAITTAMAKSTISMKRPKHENGLIILGLKAGSGSKVTKRLRRHLTRLSKAR